MDQIWSGHARAVRLGTLKHMTEQPEALDWNAARFTVRLVRGPWPAPEWARAFTRQWAIRRLDRRGCTHALLALAVAIGREQSARGSANAVMGRLRVLVDREDLADGFIQRLDALAVLGTAFDEAGETVFPHALPLATALAEDHRFSVIWKRILLEDTGIDFPILAGCRAREVRTAALEAGVWNLVPGLLQTPCRSSEWVALAVAVSK